MRRMSNMIVAVTGHRPKKLWGYDLKHPKYQKLFDVMKQFLLEKDAVKCISGMALGVDTIFAICAIKSKIYLECAIPCSNHSSKWNKESRNMYDKILSLAQETTLVTPTTYTNECMQTRNKYMVDNCNLLLAIWDGSTGGTGNCVAYAKSVGKAIHIISPGTI